MGRTGIGGNVPVPQDDKADKMIVFWLSPISAFETDLPTGALRQCKKCADSSMEET